MESRVVLDYVRSTSAEKLKRRAGEFLYKAGQSDLYANQAGGVVGYLIKCDNPSWGGSEVGGAMRLLGVGGDYVPVTAILRDALPHMVHLRRLLLPLTKGYVEKREELVQKLGLLAKGLETPDSALSIPLDELREMAKGFG